MQRPITRGAAAGVGLIFHVFAQDSASTTGAGKASIGFASWACRYIRNGEAISGAITPQDITTIGTYAAPTANTNIRIKAVDNTNMIGIYEVQIHLDWVNVTNTCQSLTIYFTATGVAVLPIQIPLRALDVQVTTQPVNVTQILGTALTETAGLLAGGFKQFFNIAAPVSTMDVLARVTLADTLTTYTGNTPQTGDVFPLASTEIADIKAKTDNLPSDPADESLIIAATDAIMTRIGLAGAGLTALGDTRIANLDATVSSRASQTSVDDLPTNAELATALGTADDAVLAAIAALNNPSAAAIADAVLDEDMTAHQTQGSLGQAIGDPVADTNTLFKAVVTDASGVTVGADTSAIKAKTDALPADPADASDVAAGLAALNDLSAADVRTAVGIASANLDTQLGAIDTAVAAVDAAIAALNDLSAAQVNAEVVDALSVDTYAAPTGVPAGTSTLAVKLGRLHEALIQGLDITATKKQFKNAAAAVVWEKDLSDDGSTYSESAGNAP